MRRSAGCIGLFLAAASLVAACDRSDSVVIVKVDADPDVADVFQLRAFVSSGGSGVMRLFPTTPAAQRIAMPTSFSLTVPRDRTGAFDIALDGLYNLPGSFGNMGPGGSTFNFVWSETGQGRMGTHPWADLRRYIANSPYYQADKIHTPFLLIHGKKDDTCPVEGAEKMFNALKRLDRTAELAIYDGEGHVPGDWSLVNAVDATQRMVDWYAKYVMSPRGAEKGGSR